MKGAEGEILYDLAIIGGGVAGAGIARDASLRNLRVILFEKNTIGSGTSSRSSKLIHGGIRYLDITWKFLKRGNFHEAWKNARFVFFSLREARILEKIAPHLVKPIPLLMPLYRKGPRSRWSVYIGVLLYFVLSRLTGYARRPRIFLGPRGVLECLPTLKTEGLAGGVLFWDRVTEDKRLVEAIASSAVARGAQVHEKTAVLSYRLDRERRIFEIRVRGEAGEKMFSAKKLVNATGPWLDETRRLGNERGEALLRPVAGCHINVKKFLPVSVLLEAEDSRTFFVINIGDISRIGTTERAHADPDHVEATDEEIDYLLRSVLCYFPQIKLSKKDILSQDAGIRPLARSGKDDPGPSSAISREHRIVPSPSGVFHVVGVKLTDHRRAAEEAVDKIVAELGDETKGLLKKTRTHRESL